MMRVEFIRRHASTLATICIAFLREKSQAAAQHYARPAWISATAETTSERPSASDEDVQHAHT